MCLYRRALTAVSGKSIKIVGWQYFMGDQIIFDHSVDNAVFPFRSVMGMWQIGAAGALQAGGPAQCEVLSSKLQQREGKILHMRTPALLHFQSSRNPPSFTWNLIWSKNGSQNKQKWLSAELSSSLSVRWITLDRLQCAVISPLMDRELWLAETEMPLQPGQTSTLRVRKRPPWRQVPQNWKSQSLSQEAEGHKGIQRILCQSALVQNYLKLNPTPPPKKTPNLW